jgi:hypothetical protein
LLSFSLFLRFYRAVLHVKSRRLSQRHSQELSIVLLWLHCLNLISTALKNVLRLKNSLIDCFIWYAQLRDQFLYAECSAAWSVANSVARLIITHYSFYMLRGRSFVDFFIWYAQLRDQFLHAECSATWSVANSVARSVTMHCSSQVLTCWPVKFSAVRSIKFSAVRSVKFSVSQILRSQISQILRSQTSQILFFAVRLIKFFAVSSEESRYYKICRDSKDYRKYRTK